MSENEGVVLKKTESFISPPQGDRKKEVVWIRHAALKEHDLMIPMEGLNSLTDLRIQAQKKISEVADGEVIIKELRRKNGELLDLKDTIHSCVKKSEILVAISDETVKAKKHIRIEHAELIKRKVELWLPIEDSTLNYDTFRNKVQDLLQVHLGPDEVLKKMTTLDGGRVIDNASILNEEVAKESVIETETRSLATKKGCFCF
ncbi:hypothetical protein HOP50_02g10540 [Chloropicon primus]|uniref:Uncharacterized protein n=1 Tax=Chloropicon primus TaxID=1764295 RepID=A0A5B8MGS3_9CHLO|nr:hypothetical protein A3770_02p10680 [Chloropicon primus]UPQ97759.1 hypothetical protein HOP50_02g10540 [Chloropicon primus]|eukprot:QDZ18550.1 hypothetical protein A3770_02p10680 [Chloropicon primus]